ncbi:MAG: hypothetical protein CMF59_07770 [Leptospiraceae bacterium]|nr:hypothetical protein [Leptospiraceae bacterium]
MAQATIDIGRAPEPEELEVIAEKDSSEFLIGSMAREAVLSSRDHLTAALKSERPVYGSNTGYGPFVSFSAREDGGEDLIQHLLVGSGPALPGELVAAAMYLRAWTMAQGRSGVRLPVIEAYLLALQDCKSGLVPRIPSIGSLGASGDLVPLAHLLNSILGRGNADSSNRTTAQSYLKDHILDRREALACINGISFSKARASLTYSALSRLLGIHEILTAVLYVALDANPDHLHENLFQSSTANCGERIRSRVVEIASRTTGASRDSEGERKDASPGNADSMRPGTSGNKNEDSMRRGYRLQAPYSLRCAPQILGACEEVLASARNSIVQDLSTIDDNPLIDPETGFVAHGGNFFGQATAFGADQMTMLACQAGVLAERQLALILDPEINGEDALMLASSPGQSSGLAGLQLTATATVAEMRSLSHMHSTYSIPTNGKNQDIVPMALLAGRRAAEVTEHLASVLGALFIASKSLWALRSGKSMRREFPFWPGLLNGSQHETQGDLGAKGPGPESIAHPAGSLGQELQSIQKAFLQRGILQNENLYH